MRSQICTIYIHVLRSRHRLSWFFLLHLHLHLFGCESYKAHLFFTVNTNTTCRQPTADSRRRLHQHLARTLYLHPHFVLAFALAFSGESCFRAPTLNLILMIFFAFRCILISLLFARLPYCANIFHLIYLPTTAAATEPSTVISMRFWIWLKVCEHCAVIAYDRAPS